MSDATSALLRALRMSANIGTFHLEQARSRDWASATFTGTRHSVTFRLEGEDAEAHGQRQADEHHQEAEVAHMQSISARPRP